MTAEERPSLYKQVFSTQLGEKVLEDLLKFVGYDKPCIDTNNVYNNYVMQGQRNVGLFIKGQLDEKAGIDTNEKQTEVKDD